MMKKVICYVICVFISLITDVSGTINHAPLNEATSVGGQVVFNCSSTTTASIIWSYTTDCNTTSYYQLTDGDCTVSSSNYTSHFRTEKPGGFVCNLIVFDASLSHGGCYACLDGYVAGGQFHAMLIIVDSKATITRNSTDLIPGDVLMISTSVSYKGPVIPSQPSSSLTPSFYWTPESNPIQNITSYQGLATDTSASSYIVVTAQKPVVPPYICNLFFNSPMYATADCASNAPTYVQSSTTDIYAVSYAPENLTISGTPNPCLHQPVVLTCSASGHPTPTYQWFDLTNLSDSNTVLIERGGSYQCVASNTIRSVPYNASITVIVFDCVNPGISDPACISLLVFVIFFGLNLISFTIFIVFYGCYECGRDTLNDRFPWLKKMLPCINGDGCTGFEWILLFTILSIFTSIIFFPTIIIVAYCCKKSKKTNQGNTGGGIHACQNVYMYENAVKPNTFAEGESYEALQLPTAESATVYEELTQKRH